MFFPSPINGHVTKSIIPQRGLHQGDPICPYLFLLCVEGFGCLIKEALRAGRLHGVTVTRGAPRLSHLFFTDDSIIFTRASMGDASPIKEILQTYENLSGQVININKSEVSFSHGLGPAIWQNIRSCLAMEEVQHHDKYPGLPTIFDHSKKISFSGIRDRIWKKL